MIKEKMKQLIGKSINKYNTQHVKDVVSELKFKEQYQGRIIDCMVGEVDDNYIETPETDSSIVKLEHSKEGLIKVPSIKGKTILVDADGNETDIPAEGCRLVSVGEEEDNKLIILSNNKNLFNPNCSITDNVYIDNNGIISPMSGYAVTNEYIKVKPSTNYICENSNHVGFYDINKNFINRGATWNSQSFTTPSNCHYIRFQIEWIGLENRNLNLHRFAEGSSINRFEIPPYQYHKTEILLKEPLREGDYIEGKKIYRNVKQDGLTLIPLEEPIIEELPNSITLQGFDDTTMYIENSITPTVTYGYNALIPYKEEVLNQQQEVETNTLDIEQNIIPYLMDMEFNLMLMEDE